MPASIRLEELRRSFSQRDNVSISTIDVEQDVWPDPLVSAEKVLSGYLNQNLERVWLMGGDRLHWIARHSDLLAIAARYRLFIFERPPHDRQTLRMLPAVEQIQHRAIFFEPVGTFSSTNMRLAKKIQNEKKINETPLPLLRGEEMTNILFIPEKQPAFESVQLLQRLVANALEQIGKTTVIESRSKTQEEYAELIPKFDVVIGLDTNLLRARKEASSGLPIILPSYGMGTRGLLPIWEMREWLQKGDVFLCPSSADHGAKNFLHEVDDELVRGAKKNKPQNSTQGQIGIVIQTVAGPDFTIWIWFRAVTQNEIFFGRTSNRSILLNKILLSESQK